jgi:hypothetical protein
MYSFSCFSISFKFVCRQNESGFGALIFTKRIKNEENKKKFLEELVISEQKFFSEYFDHSPSSFK